MAERKRRPLRDLTWVSTTYFAEGYPYNIVHNLAEILFKERGASLEQIGLTALFHLPWNLKFLWGPLVDRFGSKRSWILLIEGALVAALVALVVSVHSAHVLVAASAVFAIISFASATHDIAIDGYYLDALDTDDQSRWVGARVTAWRLSTIAVTGGLVLLIGYAGWTVGLAAGVAIMAILWAIHAAILPRVAPAERSWSDFGHVFLNGRALVVAIAVGLVAGGLVEAARRLPEWRKSWPEPIAKLSPEAWIGIALLVVLAFGAAFLPRLGRRYLKEDGFYARAFVDFLDQPGIARILAFVVLFRVGESFLLKMRYAFLSDLGMTLEQYGLASGTIGIVASFAGSILGGWLIGRDGLRRWIWPFVIGQNLLNLVYAGLAWSGLGAERIGFPLLATAISAEAFGAGLGTAVFMVYMMRCAKPGHRSAHMAILTALMSVSFTVAGVGSGYLAHAIGWGAFFAFTVLASGPAMALIPFLPHLDEAPASDSPSAESDSP